MHWYARERGGGRNLTFESLIHLEMGNQYRDCKIGVIYALEILSGHKTSTCILDLSLLVIYLIS